MLKVIVFVAAIGMLVANAGLVGSYFITTHSQAVNAVASQIK